MKTKDRVRVAAATGCSLVTVIKWDKGGSVSEATNRNLTRAASELGIAMENEDHETEKAAT